MNICLNIKMFKLTQSYILRREILGEILVNPPSGTSHTNCPFQLKKNAYNDGNKYLSILKLSLSKFLILSYLSN